MFHFMIRHWWTKAADGILTKPTAKIITIEISKTTKNLCGLSYPTTSIADNLSLIGQKDVNSLATQGNGELTWKEIGNCPFTLFNDIPLSVLSITPVRWQLSSQWSSCMPESPRWLIDHSHVIRTCFIQDSCVKVYHASENST